MRVPLIICRPRDWTASGITECWQSAGFRGLLVVISGYSRGRRWRQLNVRLECRHRFIGSLGYDIAECVFTESIQVRAIKGGRRGALCLRIQMAYCIILVSLFLRHRLDERSRELIQIN